MPDLTENELLEALREARTMADNPEGAMTTAEMAVAMNMSDPRTVRHRVAALIAEGRAEHVRVKRPKMNGVLATTDAYRLVPEDGS